MKFNTVIWDWNGTLLNDVNLAVNSINQVLKKYNLSQITIEQYRDVFCFPVYEYYKKIGFDFNKFSFELVGKEFIDIYNADFNTAHLYQNAYNTLSKIKNKGIVQVIISARFYPSLKNDLERFQLNTIIDQFYGIDSIYAESKEHLFEKFINNNPQASILYIGDTTHDRDIAQKFNLKFLFFTQGHQSLKHFQNSNHYTSINDLYEVLKWLE